MHGEVRDMSTGLVLTEAKGDCTKHRAICWCGKMLVLLSKKKLNNQLLKSFNNV